MLICRKLLLWAGLWLLQTTALAQPPKPGLFVLSVGVSKYKNPKYNLKYAHKDALDLAEAWRKQTDLYDVREVKTLVNEQATRTNIRSALIDMKKKVSPTSFLVFIFSGHGLNDALVTHEFDNDDRTATTLSRSDLTQQLSALGGNYIALLDACHSGSFAKNFGGGGKDISDFQAEQSEAIKGLLRALSASDKANIVIGSSSSSEKSDECDACQNGYFTQCLLDAFDGKPVMDGKRTIQGDVDGNGFLETNELDAYIKDAVFVMTRDRQIAQNVISHQPIGYKFSIVKPKNSTGTGQPVVAQLGGSTPAETVLKSGGGAKSISFQVTGLPAERNIDNDGDGIPNVFDQCPDQVGDVRFWGCVNDPEPDSKWTQQSNGAIPAGAVSLGTGPDGKARFLARAGYGLGYIESGSQVAKIILGSMEIEVNVYDILNKGQFAWISGSSALASGRFVPIRAGAPGVAIVRTNYNGQALVSKATRSTTEAQFKTDDPTPYKSKAFQVLVNKDAESCQMAVGAHQNMRPQDFYLYVNGASYQGLGRSFKFAEMQTGKVSLKAKYMVLKAKGFLTVKYDTLWRTTEPYEFEAKPGQTYTVLLGRTWPNKTGGYQIALADATNKELFTAPVTPTPTPSTDTPGTGSVGAQPGNGNTAQALVRVVRWKSPVTNDFETIPEERNPDAQLQGWGYTMKTYQYSAYKTRPNHPDAIAVYRWTSPNCATSITLGEHEITDAQLQSWGYKNKELQFYAYRRPPADGQRYMAVNRWINAKPQGDPCRDFTLSVAETEYADADLIRFGYSGKLLQFYVPRP